MSVLQASIFSLFIFVASFGDQAWSLDLPLPSNGEHFRITMVAPDGNDVYYYPGSFNRKTVIETMKQTQIPFANQGQCAQSLDEGIGAVEIEILYQRLNKVRGPRELRSIDKNLLGQLPVCDDYLMDLFILTKVVQGYQFVEVISEESVAAKN